MGRAWRADRLQVASLRDPRRRAGLVTSWLQQLDPWAVVTVRYVACKGCQLEATKVHAHQLRVATSLVGAQTMHVLVIRGTPRGWLFLSLANVHQLSVPADLPAPKGDAPGPAQQPIS